MFRFIHAADLHLGSPFKGIGRLLAKDRERLAAAPRKAWSNLVELALKEKADFVILAGDIFDTPQPGLKNLLAWREGLQTLDQAGIMVFAAAGNHDTPAAFSGINLPENTVIFPSDRVTFHELPQARICGISHAGTAEKRNLAKLFAGLPASPLPTLGVLHANVGSDREHEPYAPAALSDMTDNPVISYWALGHIHKRRLLHSEMPLVAYSGALQSSHVNVPGACGANLVSVDDAGRFSVEFRECGELRFLRREIVLDGVNGIDGLLEKASMLGNELRRSNDGVLTIVELLLSGRTALAGTLARTDHGELAETLNQALGGDIRLTGVKNNLVFPSDIGALLRGSHLAATVAGLAEEMRQNGAAEVAADLKALRRSIRRLPDLNPEELSGIVDEAEAELLELLANGGRP